MLKPIGHPASRQGSSRRRSAANLSRSEIPAASRLLGLLRRTGGPRDAPRVVFFLGLRNALERGLVGLVVHLRLLLFGFVVVAMPQLALRLRGRRQQRQHTECHREGLHWFFPSQTGLSANLSRGQTTANPKKALPGCTSAIIDHPRGAWIRGKA